MHVPAGPGADARPTLQLRGLSCRFGATLAVDSVDLDVPPGQMLGIIGRSGAGKSTLLRLVNRLAEPTAGGIRYGEIDVTALRGRALRQWRARCAMVFQHFNLLPRLDVLTNTLMGRLAHRADLPSALGLFTVAERAMAIQALDRFELLPVALQRAGTLSGGQQQRVALCRALLQQPDLLLADEPVASLDPHNAQVVMQALARINRDDGLTVLVNLHQLDTARAYCHRVVGMAQGRIVFDGPPAGLTDSAVRIVYGGGAPD